MDAPNTLPQASAKARETSALAHVFLQSSCSKIPGIGPKMLDKLASLGIRSLGDLLWHLPRDFEDRRQVHSANDAHRHVGRKGQFDLRIQGCNIAHGKTQRLVVTCVDAQNEPDEILQLLFFKPQPRLVQQWQKHETVRVFGEVHLTSYNGLDTLQITHPEFQFLDQGNLELEQTLTPIYASSQGLHQKSWRRWFHWLFEQLNNAPFSIDTLDPIWSSLKPPLTNKISLLEAFEAVHQGLHMTTESGQLVIYRQHQAIQRLALEELIRQQILWAPRCNQDQSLAVQVFDQHTYAITSRLPFELTGAQQRCVDEILQDLQKSTPMNRLLQGDVGCGKTLVAAIAAAQVALDQSQVAILAPTEILAQQHYAAFTQFVSPLELQVDLLTGKRPTAEKQQVLHDLAFGATNIVIGTHALFQKDVTYKNLRMIVIDEQHRFGVEQRLSLLRKGTIDAGPSKPLIVPHQLMMSATPIPRTLTMSIYAQLATSIIDELPPSRKEVVTRAIGEDRREELYTRAMSFIATGQQVFWVCPLIHDSETAGEKKSVEQTEHMLTQALPGVTIGLLHSQLGEDEKKHALENFICGKTQLLISTSMVEVGVNIPNANLMVVEDAQNWGLTQLHQLRGRVGRGDQPGYMMLLHKSPMGKIAHERLDVLRQTNDGFEIAQKDLEIRGPGHIQGTAQSGHWTFKVADLQQDQALFPQAKIISSHILKEHPDIANLWRESTPLTGQS